MKAFFYIVNKMPACFRLKLLNGVGFFFVVFLLTACKTEFEPQVIANGDNYLVVEGMLNPAGTTTITLSRTRPLNISRHTDSVKPELKAIVSIESDNSKSFILAEAGKGIYTSQLNLSHSEQYRLRIKTINGKEYLSDFVSVISTPSIDSISWKLVGNDVQIYVSTHDPQNRTHYYRWGFEETWVRAGAIPPSYFEYINGYFVRRKAPTPGGMCYTTRIEDPLLLATTIKLTDDVVFMAPVNLIRKGSVKLESKYSILVKQYALEKNAYEYWIAMKKNTEQLGSITDPHPSYLYGNIHSVSDPNEKVIGYLSACNVTEKRIFITNSEAKWLINSDCAVFEETNLNPDTLALHFGTSPPALRRIPLDELRTASGSLYGYTAVNDGCLDCKGTFIKPTFWQ